MSILQFYQGYSVIGVKTENGPFQEYFVYIVLLAHTWQLKDDIGHPNLNRLAFLGDMQ